MSTALVFAWSHTPTIAQLLDVLQQHPEQEIYFVVPLFNKRLPEFAPLHRPTDLAKRLQQRLTQQLSCVQFNGANVLNQVLPNVHFFLLPEHAICHLRDHFPHHPIVWQTDPITQSPPLAEKPWQKLPPIRPLPEHIIVVGAGIAGASTAYELACRGIKVTVLEKAHAVASSASGNHQGLLYAKISPHNTEQTELLLAGYGYTQRLLDRVLPENEGWSRTGILHLNHNLSETKRNQELGKQHWHQHLYRPVNAQQASALAGINIEQSGLFWQQGLWLNPATLIKRLLQHENIRVCLQSPLIALTQQNGYWLAQTPTQTLQASHMVFCTGADHASTPIVCDLPLQVIRGQTSLAQANAISQKLKIALSGESYISPQWQNWHCFGASFINHDPDCTWREQDEQHNRQALQKLNPHLFQSFDFTDTPRGHTAIRCDSHDHLPVVGALGDIAQMLEVYQKLALDKNYRLTSDCPYLPNVYVNTAHGSRGFCTAPICAHFISAQICHQPLPFSSRIRHALNPNRLSIRQIVRQRTSISTSDKPNK